MIRTDFLIIGQGIAGTLLSFELMQRGKTVLVLDKNDPFRASLVAGAVLNPMAGKHWSPSPQADLFLPKAKEIYKRIETLLNIKILQETSLHVCHESDEKQVHFEQQQKLFPQYLQRTTDKASPFFNTKNGSGIINGISVVDAEILLSAWKNYLLKNDAFSEEEFDVTQLKVEVDSVCYKNIEASKIIFCTGVEAMANPFFKNLPFTKNRGDVLIIEIPELPATAVYHQTLRLVPKGKNLFWCGSNYQWDFENLLPNEKWKQEAIAVLRDWLKIPFTIKNHIVAQRPTTAGQIPIVGIHPKDSAVAILNGLGTRGFSTAPYWASELAKQLLASNS